MKILVLYFSVDGNTEAVAKAIAEEVGGDLTKIVRVKGVKAYGRMTMFKHRMEVARKKKPDIFPIALDPRDFDLIFIGTPVWYGSFNPVYNTLFDVIKIYDRKIALFSTGEEEDTKALDKLSSFLSDSVLLGTFHCEEPIWWDEEEKTQEILNDAKAWAKNIATEAKQMIEKEEFERRKTIYKY